MNLFLKLVLTYVVALVHLWAIWLGLKLFFPYVDFWIILISMLAVSNAIGWQLGKILEKLINPIELPVIDFVLVEKNWTEEVIPESVQAIVTQETTSWESKKTWRKQSPETIEKIRVASFAREKAKREQKERLAKTKEIAEKKRARRLAMASTAPIKVTKVSAKKKTVKK